MIDSFKDVSHPADVWSLGAMMFELLTGTRPFGSGYGAVPAIQAAVVPPLPPAMLGKLQFATLSQELYGIILRCLKRKPDERPGADEVVRLCQDLCYAVMEREFGTIGYMPHQNSGFITRPGQVDVFFHQNSVPAGRVNQGQRVWFSRHPGEPRERAFPIVPARD